MNNKIEYKEDKTGIEVVNEILIHVNEILNDFKQSNPSQQFLFRGQANEEWKLLPGLFRIKDRPIDFEYNMIHFLKSKKFESDKDNDELEISIDAQHFSYPTRLLDVSYNVLNALYFSCEKIKATNCDEKNAILYIIKVEMLCPGTS